MKKPVVLVAFVAFSSFLLGGVAFSTHDFPDVADSNPFHDDISWMAEEGITSGFSDGTFRPGEPVTRQSMSAFMRRLAGDDPDVGRVVDAAQLQGRTPADFDDAVTLGGRTPADFDDAETLDGLTRQEVMTSTGYGQSTGGVTITGTTPGTATALFGFGGASTYMVNLTMLVDTGYASGLFTCQVDGDPIRGITDLKLGDTTPGYTDRMSVSGQYRLTPGGALQVRCFHESAAGSGSVIVREWAYTYIEDS